MKTEGELQEMASDLSKLCPDDPEDQDRFIELVKHLTRPDAQRIVDILSER